MTADAVRRYEAALDRCTTASEVVAELLALVGELGGRAVPAREVDASLLPIDVTLGTADPVLVQVDAASIARLDLESALPAATAAAHRTVARLGATAGRGSAP